MNLSAVMKPLLPLLLCTGALAQVPAPPTNLRLATEPPSIILVAVEREGTDFVARWVPPDTNRWIAEWSTNYSTWSNNCSELIVIEGRSNRIARIQPPSLHMLSTATNWTDQWFVRIRKQ